MAIYRWEKYAISIDESSYAMSKGPISGYVFGYGADRQDTILVYVTANKPAIVNDAYDFSKARTNYVSPTSYASLTDTLWFSFEDRAPTTMYKLQSAGTLGWMSDYGVYTVVQPYVYTLSETVGEFIEYVYSETSSAYPNGGISGSYYYSERTEITDPVLTVPSLAMQSAPLVIEWTAINDDTATYVLERKADSGEWAQIYSGANLTYTDTIGTWSTVQYRVKAGVSGVHGDYTTSEAISVVAASALVISGTDSDLGTLTAPVGYSVSSDTGNTITVTEEVNGVILRTYTTASGVQQSIPIPDLPTGSGSITIKASVQATAGTANQTRNWTYTKTAPAFPSGPFDISTLSKGGKTQFPLTLAEAVKMPLGMGMVGVQQHIEEVYTGDTSAEQVATVFNNLGPGTACTEKPTWDEENQIYVPKGTTYTCTISGDPDQTHSSSGIWAYRVVQNQAKYYIKNSIKSRYYYASTATHAQSYYFSDVATLLSYDPVFEDSIVVDPTIRDLLGNPVGVQIATGSYVGTGTYGANNPNTLTFEFEPKLVVIKSNISMALISNWQKTAATNNCPMFYIQKVTGDSNYFVGIVCTFSGNTISYYNTSSPVHQLNNNGTIYTYVAIG